MDSGSTAHQVRVLESGARLHRWEPDGGARSGGAQVLLQHGYGEYAERWIAHYHRFIPRLRAAGYTVWAMDLLGHGRSPGRRGVVDVRRSVADHVAVRREAAEGGPLLCVGHSLGGLVTAGSLTAAPSGAAGAVLLSPAIVPPAPAALRWAVDAAARLAPAAPAPLKPSPEGALTRLPEEVAAAGADPLRYQGRLTLSAAAGILDTAAGVWRTLGRWRTPCLVVHGTDDTVTDPAQSERFTAALPVADSTFVRVAGGRHELLNDLGGAALAGTVLDWLGAHAGR
ncbi:alpha/beta fold hydrolase [Nocardiopsis coralliicola]